MLRRCSVKSTLQSLHINAKMWTLEVFVGLSHEGQNESVAQISGANFQANPWIRNQSFNKY